MIMAAAKESASSFIWKFSPYTWRLSRHWWNVGVAWLYLRPLTIAQLITTCNTSQRIKFVNNRFRDSLPSFSKDNSKLPGEMFALVKNICWIYTKQRVALYVSIICNISNITSLTYLMILDFSPNNTKRIVHSVMINVYFRQTKRIATGKPLLVSIVVDHYRGFRRYNRLLAASHINKQIIHKYY